MRRRGWMMMVMVSVLVPMGMAACEKKNEVPDAEPAEAKAVEEKGESEERPDSEQQAAGTSYQELQAGYEQLAEQYEEKGQKLPEEMTAFGPRMREMHRQMGHMHQRAGRQHGHMMGRHGRGHQGQQRMRHRRRQRMHGQNGCGPQTTCWASGIDQWHTQMAQMHEQMAEERAQAGFEDLAKRHRQMAERHAHFARELEQDAEAEGTEVAAAEEPDTDARATSSQGKRLYLQACAMCHGGQGTGVAGAFPPLAKSEYVTGSKDRLISIVLHGLSGPIEVRGQKYDSVMPAFGGRFTDAQLASILTHIRTSWGNDASTVTAEEVEHVREGEDDEDDD